MRYCNVGCSSNSPPKPLHMRLAARLVAVSPSILFVSFGALGFFFFLFFSGLFRPFLGWLSLVFAGGFTVLGISGWLTFRSAFTARTAYSQPESRRA